MVTKLLIANRGEIAVRIMRTARRMGIATVAVYSDADALAAHVREADEAIAIGPAAASESYLVIERIIDAARESCADAIHPGYGFLSENPDFAAACEAVGITLVGPSAAAMRAMGRKDAAKKLMEEAGVPVTPGYHGEQQEAGFLAEAAARIGFPVLIKAVAGGGGKGMRRVDRAEDFAEALESAQREARNAFGNDQVLLEKFILNPRHIEVQIMGDTHGHVVHFHERDCSLQRRHQKVIEEAPAPGLNAAMRANMHEAAVRAAAAIGYVNAGTIEFIVSADDAARRADGFYFMEMNTRLQVEHPVTEMITGVDLVEWQIRVARGEALPAQDQIKVTGHAMEARIYAEDPAQNFLPQTGDILHLVDPSITAGDEDEAVIRWDSGVEEGDSVTPYYDPMIGKLIVHAVDRHAALEALGDGVLALQIAPLRTNTGFLYACVRHPAFGALDFDTGFIDAHLSELNGTGEEQDARSALAAGVARALCREGARLSGRTDIWHDPFGRADGFRFNRAPRWIERMTLGDRLVRIEADGVPQVGSWRASEVSVDTTPLGAAILYCGAVEFDEMTAGVALLRFLEDDALVDVSWQAGSDAGETWAWVDGHLLVARDPQFSHHADEGEAADDIRAPMPGKVQKLGVRVGQEVARGDTLVVLEAMKMEHALKAPRDGTVASVAVGEGDQVTEKALLVALESLENN